MNASGFCRFLVVVGEMLGFVFKEQREISAPRLIATLAVLLCALRPPASV